MRRATLYVAIFMLVLIAAVRAAQSLMLRHSDAYEAAVHFVSKCPNVASSLGKPVQLNYRQGLSLGEVPAAEFEIAVTGEQNRGNVYLRVLKKNGKWYVSAANIELPDGAIRELRCDFDPPH